MPVNAEGKKVRRPGVVGAEQEPEAEDEEIRFHGASELIQFNGSKENFRAFALKEDFA